LARKVEVRRASPGVFHACNKDLLASTAAIGRPPPSALPQQRTSGRTPSASTAKRRPVLPKPVKISSAISTAPASRQSRAIPASQPGGGGSTPSRPTIGSPSTAPAGPPAALSEPPELAALVALVEVVASADATVASGQPKGMRRTCGW